MHGVRPVVTISKSSVVSVAPDAGATVAVGDEKFYKLFETDATVILMSKYNLDTTGTVQQNADESTTGCNFSNSMYWGEENLNKNLNDIDGYEDTDAVGKAKRYAQSLGAIGGRLLTQQEAAALNSRAKAEPVIATVLWGKDSVDGYLYYWLSTLRWSNRYFIYYVDGKSSKIDDSYGDLHSYGIRPVITISKDLVS